MEHAQALHVTIGPAQAQDAVLDGVLALGRMFDHLTLDTRWHQDSVDDGLGLLNRGEDLARLQFLSDLNIRVGNHVPLVLAIQRHDLETAGDVLAAHLQHLVQRSLQAVEDLAEHARTQLHRQRVTQIDDLLARFQRLGRLIHLDQRIVLAQVNHLAHDAKLADLDLGAVDDARLPDADDRPVDLQYFTHDSPPTDSTGKIDDRRSGASAHPRGAGSCLRRCCRPSCHRPPR